MIMTNDFFEDIGKRISKTAEEVGKKTNEVIAKQKVKNQIAAIKNEVLKHYEEIGRSIEEKYERQEEVEAEHLVLCKTISEKKKLIEIYKEQLIALARAKACKNCGAIIDKGDIFCKKCGSNTGGKNKQGEEL
jgi:Predicted membrane protein